MSNAALKLTPSPAIREVTQSPSPQQAAPQNAAPLAAPAPKKPMRGRIIRGVLLLAVLATAAYYGQDWYRIGRFQISTDDAYVKTDMSLLGTKMAGYVKEAPFADNSAVKAGDVIMRLDSSDYELALASAKARVDTQKTAIATIAQQVLAQQAQINAVSAQLDSAKAIEKNVGVTQARAADLFNRKVGTQQALDDANAALATAHANAAAAAANIEAAKAQLGVLNAQSTSAQSLLSELNIAVTKAQSDLAATEIKAPFAGIVANRAVQPGQFVGAGSRLLALVPVQDSYIEANFKETQLVDIHAGQAATITVDAFKGEKYQGTVQSVAPASGAEFSLLPPENATGNFTKITQRVPVKVSIPPELAAKLRPGLSVYVSVDLRDVGK